MAGNEASPELTGGCQCGAIRYRLAQEPAYASICHCRMCQKAGGAPFMAFFSVAEKNLTVTQGAFSTFRSSDIAERGFCAACGTPLTYKMDGREDISLTIGSLDQPENVPPTAQLGAESMLPWFRGLAELPATDSSAWMKKYRIVDAGSRQHPDRET